MNMEGEHQTTWRDAVRSIAWGDLCILRARPTWPHTQLFTALLSPTGTYPIPHQTQIYFIHLTCQELLRAGCSRLLCSLVDLLVLFLARHPLPQKHTQPCTPNYSFSPHFHMLQSVVVVLVVVMKVVVMVTPFSPSANSAGFLSTELVCECASFSCSPFKITAIRNVSGM